MNTRYSGDQHHQQRIREWMMAQLDGETTPEQDADIALWIHADPALRQEFEQMKAVKNLTRQQRPDDLAAEKWDQYWLDIYPRLERGVGWVLMSIGALVLILFGSWEIAREWILSPDIPLWIKAAGISFWSGLTILLISVVREKWFLHKQERYKDIQR
jgi:ferric-dicitrate binding protein FerR (iron transport regulator)